MIISRVQITNYKQYVGDHDVTIPSAATIGVIGANGVGKTTLFQAIEWALYGTGVASTKDIRPRGRSGNTIVTLTLDLPGTGEQFIVERELRKSSTRAVVYKVEEDGEEAIVVQGAAPVSTYVQDALIGLDHKAFTATFFTRQKELGFFGDLGDSARRREVGKLLGLETIRLAQQRIGEDRLRARNEATVLEKQYENQSRGHDFPAEIAAAEESISTLKQSLAVAHDAVDKATTGVKALEKALSAQQSLKDQDSAAASKILELRGQMHSANQHRDSCVADLGRLDERVKERDALAETATRLETLQQQLSSFDEQRNRYQRRQQVQQAIAANERRRSDVITSVRTTVLSVTPPSPVDGWAWMDSDGNDPVGACERLLTALGKVRIDDVEQREQAFQRLHSLAKDCSEARTTLQKFRDRRAQLDATVRQLTEGGDPAERLASLKQRLQEIQRQDAEIGARLKHMASERQKIDRLANNLRQHDFSDGCPTCQRPFTQEEATQTLEVFQSQLDRLRRDAESVQGQSQALARDQSQVQQECAGLETQVLELQKTRQAIEASIPFINDQMAKCDELDRLMQEHLTAAGRSSIPTDDEISTVRMEAQTWRRMIDMRQPLEHRKRDLIVLEDEIVPLRRDLEAIGEVNYDEAAHRNVTAAHQEALKAATTVAQIDRELIRRPQIETELAATKEKIVDLTARIETAERERATIGFDPERLTRVENELRAAREERDTAIEMRHRIQGQLTAAEHARESLVNERDRIAGLATQAEEQRHLHDRLDQMYKEFDEFDRYAAAWYAPRLSEITSELVADVTDGKYDRVVFDNNFGIDIYDGEDEKFPLDTFSGGERDAIALCARIALSRVIGGTGSHPLGFLVLDEVFGSLDLDRRQRLLEMLGTITGSGEHFRQVFIISHVDDVRTSPIFDELWQIVENAEGSSELRALSPGSDIGEL